METLTPGPLELDNTKRSCFKTCKRKYYLRYVLHLKTFAGSNALRYGLVWHAGMDAYYGNIQKNGWTHDGSAIQEAFVAMKKEWDETSAKENYFSDYRTLENCFKSFLQYIQHFQQDELMLKILNTEEPFKIVMQPENEEEAKIFKGLELFYFTGKIDLEVELNGRQWIKEHKTTGQPIDVQVNRLNRSAQVMGYFYAKKRISYGQRIPDGVLLGVHHLSCRKSTAKGREGEYLEPKIDFRRVPQIFSDNDIHQWRMSFMDTALEIQMEMARGLWPMNHDSCFDYGSCPFLGICEQSTSVDTIWIDEHRYYVGEPWEVAKSITADGVIN